MQILSIHLGRVQPVQIGALRIMSAFAKTAHSGPLAVGRLGLAGDEQADPCVHGGLAKAVYAYPSEHAAFWQQARAQLGLPERAMGGGAVGENLSMQGLLETDLWLGDLLIAPVREGQQVVLCVTQARQPCDKFNHFMGWPHAARAMAQSGRCGVYLSVLQTGWIAAGDALRLQPGPRQTRLLEQFRTQLHRIVRD